MKKKLLAAATVLAGLLLSSCLGNAKQEPSGADPVPKSGELTVGKDILAEDITDFYFTRENINYMANYLRYRFYTEDGKRLFYYEKREKEDYGPATEEDITAVGTIELTDHDWMEFFGFLKGGSVRKREISDETGDSGPWTYLYWSGDRSEYQQYTFPSVSAQLSFEQYCESLAQLG